MSRFFSRPLRKESLRYLRLQIRTAHDVAEALLRTQRIEGRIHVDRCESGSYGAGFQAVFEIRERHRHSKRNFRILPRLLYRIFRLYCGV